MSVTYTFMNISSNKATKLAVKPLKYSSDLFGHQQLAGSAGSCTLFLRCETNGVFFFLAESKMEGMPLIKIPRVKLGSQGLEVSYFVLLTYVHLYHAPLLFMGVLQFLLFFQLKSLWVDLIIH